MRILRTVFLLSLGLAAPVAGQAVDAALYQSMEWRNIGPFRGGRSNASTGVIQEPDTFYFGGVGGGVWKTTDGGVTWNNVSDGFFDTASVGAIAVAPSDPNVVFVGMGEHAVRGVMTSHGDGVYKSTDAGKTWTHVGLDGSRAISRIRIHPENPDRVYVAVQGAPYGPSAERGVYRSLDGGASWKKILYVSDDAGASDLDMDPGNPRILYAAFWDHRRTPWEIRSGGPGSGIHKSTDGGESWVEIGTGDEGFPDERGKMSVAVSANSNRIYALVEADPGGGLYRSDDAGESFELVNDTWTIRARAWYYIKVFADPKNEDVVWITNARLLKSIDGGETFTRVATPHGDNHHLWIHPDNTDVMINSNDGGANVTHNGGKSWSTQQNQPTAQFYRVNTDHRFPYYVYGGQQDNTSVAIASQSFNGGIDWKDWYAVGGCESAFTAFDKDDPSLVYAGCYMGQISQWDQRTGSAHNVMAYPTLPAGLASRDMKYRFNWNAPIVVSQHDPNVIYHGANVLLRTTNGGIAWSAISGDLTRDDDEKQGPGGGPITNEGAGGEIYGTIAYLAESPHDARELWVGTDDGYVQLTRDSGASWQNVTPDGVGEALINAIDVSPHQPGAAYVAVTKYKFNDFTPLAFETTDYGKSWTRITNGIPDGAWVRVVREDPVRRGLLYMGTETGIYVSFDDGGNWQSLQLNLPVVPITDLQVQTGENDLVAATQGRSFWILDELSPLQQVDDEVERASAHLFAPGPAIRVQRGSTFGSQARMGNNPPEGAILDYVLGEVDAETDEARKVTLEILDTAGGVVRSYTSEDEDDDDAVLSNEPGMHRLSWDLRHETPKKVPGLYIFGQLRGRLVPPGTYRVRLTVGDEVQSQTVEVRRDPRLETSEATYMEQDAFLADVATEISAVHESVIRLRDVRDQVKALLDRFEDHEHQLASVVREAGEAYVKKLDAMEDELIQKRTVDGQTVINFPTRLNQHYIYLHAAVDGSDSGVLDGARERFRDLETQWGELERQVEQLLGPELDAFNTIVRDAGVPPVMTGVSL